MPASSRGTLQHSAVGDIAISSRARDINAPVELYRVHDFPSLSGPSLQDTGLCSPGTCSGSWGRGYDDPSSPAASQDPGGNGLSYPAQVSPLCLRPELKIQGGPRGRGQ